VVDVDAFRDARRVAALAVFDKTFVRAAALIGGRGNGRR